MYNPIQKIGIKSTTYNTFRNFAALNVPGFEYKKVVDITKLIEYPIFKGFNKIPHLLHHLFYDFNLNSVDFYHFFNTTYLGSKPWFVTFEDTVPRFNTRNKRLIRFGLNALAKNNCKSVIAMSSNCYNRQMYILDQYPDFKNQIVSKMNILHPSQKVMISDIGEKKINYDKIRLTFVGKFFFHKGGLELLRACKRLKEAGYQFELTIVSNFQRTGWLDNHITDFHFERAKEILSQCSNIKHHSVLPNSEVLELFRNSDIGLLPSYGESYGYSVLESQAYGCPVITTNVWALPEINTERSGWLLNVPRVLNNGGFEADLSSTKKISDFSLSLEEELFITIKRIIENPSEIYTKAENAINNLKLNHSPLKAVENLKSHYSSIS